MKGRYFAVATLLTVAAMPLQAQANCPQGGSATQNAVRDACVTGSDIFQYLGPQLGLAIAGGNATIGQGGTLGGFPHFVVSVRGNVLAGDIPDVSDPAYTPRTNGAPRTEPLPSSTQVIGLPVVDAAIGIFKGIPLGLTNVGGVDLLLSAAYVPEIGSEEDDFQISPERPIEIGFGARLGLLQESLLAPGVSATFIQRNLPTTDIFARLEPTATQPGFDLEIANTSIKTRSWRVVASKSLLVFGLAAGVGQDTYDLGTTLDGVVRGGVLGTNEQPVTADFVQKMTRTNMFLDASLNLPFIKFVGEIGRASGGEVGPMVNSFSGGDANKPRVYGSLGVRLGL